MTPRVFTGLAVAALGSLLSAVVLQSSHGSWSSGTVAGQPLMPSLAQTGGDVASIEIRQGEKTLTLQKQDARGVGGAATRSENDAGWAIKERGGFPAKADKVRALMVQLAQAEMIERKTLNPARYGVIELEDPAGKDAKSRGLRLLAKSDKPIAEIVLGKKKYEAFGAGKSGVYVRKPGDPQTWLASGDIETSLDVKEWVERGVLDLDAAKISKVSVVNAAGETLTFARVAPAAKPVETAKPEATADAAKADAAKSEAKPDPASEVAKPVAPAPNLSKPAEPEKDLKNAPFAFLELPAGKALKQGVAADAVPKSFAGLEFEDVRKASETPAKEGVTTAKIETLDGMTVNVALRKEGSDSWMSLTATGTDKAGEAAIALTKRAQGWEFKIPSWKADAVSKKKADFIDEKPEGEKPKP